MLMFKIVFWLYVASVVVRLIETCQDHPRQPKPVNVGTDIAGVICNMVMAIFLYLAIWG